MNRPPAPVIVVAPDKFKGSLSAPAVAAAVAQGLRRVWPDAEIRACPVADGGDGTLDAILACGGTRGTREVSGASGARRSADYGIVETPLGPTAIIEVAQIVALIDAAGTTSPVSRRTTRGVGELVEALLDQGVRRFLVGLGGSSTNDGGAGMLAALGVRLIDADGAEVAPTPEGLAALAQVDAASLDTRLAQSDITIMSDVDNPLCGARGATAIFGPQKGVRDEEVPSIDATLARWAGMIERALGREAAATPGAGAAGGLGFAFKLAGGRLRSGAEVVAEIVGLDRALAGAGWAITGEGRSDAQTLLRKAPFVVAEKARARGVPATLLSGAIDAAALRELDRHFSGCFALPAGPASRDDSMSRAASLLADRAEALARLWSAASQAASGVMHAPG